VSQVVIVVIIVDVPPATVVVVVTALVVEICPLGGKTETPTTYTPPTVSSSTLNVPTQFPEPVLMQIVVLPCPIAEGSQSTLRWAPGLSDPHVTTNNVAAGLNPEPETWISVPCVPWVGVRITVWAATGFIMAAVNVATVTSSRRSMIGLLERERLRERFLNLAAP
jgi:hypothetical protein